MDKKKKWEFLEQEQKQIFAESKAKNGIVDCLVKVYMKDGTDHWILIHIEVQGQKGNEDFGKRMFRYFYRIFDMFDKDITALVIFTGEDANYMPDKYEIKYAKTRIFYKFNVYKVKDKSEEELLKEKNIFGLVIYSVLKVLGVKDETEKKELKKELIKKLMKSGKHRNQIEKVFKFLDYLIMISKELNKQIRDELQKEGEIEMETERLMSWIEKEGYKKGEAIGVTKGEAIGVTKGEAIGVTKGKKEGIIEATISSVKKMYKKNFNAESISEILELDYAFVQKVISEHG